MSNRNYSSKKRKTPLILTFLTILFFLVPQTDAIGILATSLKLDNYTINAVANYSFQISPQTQLTTTGKILVYFDPSLNIILPKAPKCEGLNGFNGNLLCTRYDENSILLSLTTMKTGQSIYQFDLLGITNPDSALKVTDQIKVTSGRTATNIADVSSKILIQYTPFQVDSNQASLRSSNTTVGVYAPFHATLTLANSVPQGGKILLIFPKWQDPAKGATLSSSMVTTETVTSCEVIFNNAVCTVEHQQDQDIVTVTGAFSKAKQLAGTKVEVIMNQVRNPTSTQPMPGFSMITTDKNDNYIDVCSGLSLSVHDPAVAPVLESYVQLTGDVGLDQLGTYDFYYQTNLPMPVKSSIIIRLPKEITYQYISTVKYTGHVNAQKNVQIKVGETPDQIELHNVISNYLQPGHGVLFSIAGLKNPSSTLTTDSFSITSFDAEGYIIESLQQNLTINAVSGNLDNVHFTPLDVRGVRMYATEHEVSLKMTSALHSDGFIEIQMQNYIDDFFIDVDQDCQVENMNLGIADNEVVCKQNKTTRTITLSNIINGTQSAPNTNVNFKLKNTKIRNPISVIKPGVVKVRTKTPKMTVDSGDSSDWFAIPAPFTSTKIQPNTVLTQLPNIEYLFTISTAGQIVQDSTVTVVLPAQVIIMDKDIIENKCGFYFKSGLPTRIGTSNPMQCQVTNSNTVVITNMFQFGPTQDFPTIQFTIPGLQNPRLKDVATDSFQIFIQQGEIIQYNVTQNAVIYMNLAVEFSSLTIKPESIVNQANTSYQFTFVTHLPLEEGDYFEISVPDQIVPPAFPICVGDNETIHIEMKCTLSGPQTIRATPVKALNTTDPLNFMFIVKNMINPKTTQTTESFHVTQFSKDGNITAHDSSDLGIRMYTGKPLEAYRLQMTPDSFDSKALTNYIVEFLPTTIFDGMYLKIEFPAETVLTNTSACQHVVCKRYDQTMIINNWENFNVTNIINPVDKIITSHFKLQSFTSQNYLIEELDTFKLNFKCALPCDQCLGDSNRVCQTCFPTGKYLLYAGMCYSECPEGLFLQSDNKTCSPCPETCKACVDFLTCTSCEPNSRLINSTCPKDLPFPYFMPCLILSVLWMLYTTYIECKKKSSRWIPLSLSGLTYTNKVLAGIQLFVFYTHNMDLVFLYVLIAGFIFPFLISLLFSVIYLIKFRRDLNVTRHRTNHRKLHNLGFLGVFLSDYRSWKYLYTNINSKTQMLAFKVQFKYYNRALSFACMLTDCFLAFAGGAALTTGLTNNLPLIIYMNIERLILSFILITLTVCEWAFKSKISKEEKLRIHPAVKVQDINVLDKTAECLELKIADPEFDSADEKRNKALEQKLTNKDLKEVCEELGGQGKKGKKKSVSPGKEKKPAKGKKGQSSEKKSASKQKTQKGSNKKSASKSPEKKIEKQTTKKSKKINIVTSDTSAQLAMGQGFEHLHNNSATNDEHFEQTFRAHEQTDKDNEISPSAAMMAKENDMGYFGNDFRGVPNQGHPAMYDESDTTHEQNIGVNPNDLATVNPEHQKRYAATGGLLKIEQPVNDRIARSTFQNESVEETDEWGLGSAKESDDHGHYMSEVPGKVESPFRGRQKETIKRGTASQSPNKKSPFKAKKSYVEDQEPVESPKRYLQEHFSQILNSHGGVNHFAKPKKSPRVSKVKPNRSYLDNQEVSVLRISAQKQLNSNKKTKSPERD